MSEREHPQPEKPEASGTFSGLPSSICAWLINRQYVVAARDQPEALTWAIREKVFPLTECRRLAHNTRCECWHPDDGQPEPEVETVGHELEKLTPEDLPCLIAEVGPHD